MTVPGKIVVTENNGLSMLPCFHVMLFVGNLISTENLDWSDKPQYYK